MGKVILAVLGGVVGLYLPVLVVVVTGSGGTSYEVLLPWCFAGLGAGAAFAPLAGSWLWTRRQRRLASEPGRGLSERSR